MPAVTKRLGSARVGLTGGWVGGLLDTIREEPGLEIGVACLGTPPFEPFESDRVRYYSIPLNASGSTLGRVAGRWTVHLRPESYLPTCRRVVSDFGPDLVHVNGTEYAVGLIADSIACPCVVSIQGVMTVFELMWRRSVDLDYRRSFSPGLLLRGLGQFMEPRIVGLQARNERRVLERCSFFTGRTRFDHGLVQMFSPNARYFHCDRIIRPEFWAHEWSETAATKNIIFSSIGINPRKGLGTLLEAMALLLRRNPDMRLRLAGRKGDVESARMLRRKVSRLRLGSAVSLLGPLPAVELASELLRARVFVHPSHCENSPNALAEAMVVGTPCVATAVGGVSSLARDGIEAQLVQDGDPVSLAAQIAAVLEDDALARRLSAAARETARLRHDPTRVKADLLQAYAEIAALHGAD